MAKGEEYANGFAYCVDLVLVTSKVVYLKYPKYE